MLFLYLSLIVLKDFVIFSSDNSDVVVLDEGDADDITEKAVTGRGRWCGGCGRWSQGGHTSHQAAPGKQKTLSSIVKKEKPESPVKRK